MSPLGHRHGINFLQAIFGNFNRVDSSPGVVVTYNFILYQYSDNRINRYQLFQRTWYYTVWGIAPVGMVCKFLPYFNYR